MLTLYTRKTKRSYCACWSVSLSLVWIVPHDGLESGLQHAGLLQAITTWWTCNHAGAASSLAVHNLQQLAIWEVPNRQMFGNWKKYTVQWLLLGRLRKLAALIAVLRWDIARLRVAILLDCFYL